MATYGQELTSASVFDYIIIIINKQQTKINQGYGDLNVQKEGHEDMCKPLLNNHDNSSTFTVPEDDPRPLVFTTATV